MRKIEVLGPGCARCRATYAAVSQVVAQDHLDCDVEKVESIERMVELGVIATPALAVDGRLVHQGSQPGPDEVRRLLGLA